ncbi:MAG: hypothetical protein K2L37_03305 [Lactobacillus sp.]|nr:hypothetical protein [Lactobacillus sp.]
MTELTVKKSELRVRQKRDTSGYLPIWEVLSVTMYSDGSVARAVLCERDSYEKAMAVLGWEVAMSATIEEDMDTKEEITSEMRKAAERAQNYDCKALYDRWPSMTPVEVIAECKEVLRIHDVLQQTPEPLGLDALNSDGFMDAMLFLESFCMRYLVDIFFNGQ